MHKEPKKLLIREQKYLESSKSVINKQVFGFDLQYYKI